MLLEHIPIKKSNMVSIKMLKQRGPYQGARTTRSLSRCSSNTVPIKVLEYHGAYQEKQHGPYPVLLKHIDRDRVARAP
jgi:hypothetical protein